VIITSNLISFDKETIVLLIIALEQEVIAVAITIALIPVRFLYASDVRQNRSCNRN